MLTIEAFTQRFDGALIALYFMNHNAFAGEDTRVKIEAFRSEQDTLTPAVAALLRIASSPGFYS